MHEGVCVCLATDKRIIKINPNQPTPLPLNYKDNNHILYHSLSQTSLEVYCLWSLVDVLKPGASPTLCWAPSQWTCGEISKVFPHRKGCGVFSHRGVFFLRHVGSYHAKGTELSGLIDNSLLELKERQKDENLSQALTEWSCPSFPRWSLSWSC